jgi:3-oxoacyl-[acyl-carrier protein] reductase
MQQLDGKIAIVTGASRGLGKAIADVYADAGATVVALDLKATWAQATADAIVARGGRAVGMACDVADRAAIQQIFDEVAREFGRIDILVNNAMWNRYEPLAEIQPETADRMIAVGFTAIVWALQAVVPVMRAHGGGTVVNIASVSAQLGIPNALLYCGVKAGVTGLTRAAAVELGPDNIRVNAIAPSTVATEGVLAMMSDDVFANRISRTPLRRLGETGDIASVALFLASDAAGFMTGQVLTVDGGLANAFI